jgi:hypothetical protein
LAEVDDLGAGRHIDRHMLQGLDASIGRKQLLSTQFEAILRDIKQQDRAAGTGYKRCTTSSTLRMRSSRSAAVLIAVTTASNALSRRWLICASW